MTKWDLCRGVAALAVCGGLFPAAAQLPMDPAGRLVSVGGRSAYIEERGAGNPVVLLHGWGATTTTWNVHIDTLAAHHRVIAVDLPGHGRSSPLDTSIVFRNEQRRC